MPMRSERLISGIRTWCRMKSTARLVENALFEDLEGADDDPFGVDCLGVDGHRARRRAAHVGQMAEHAGPADELSFEVNRHQNQPVV